MTPQQTHDLIEHGGYWYRLADLAEQGSATESVNEARERTHLDFAPCSPAQFAMEWFAALSNDDLAWLLSVTPVQPEPRVQ